MLESSTAKNGAKIDKVQFQKFRQLALGSGAFVQPVLVYVKSLRLAADFVVLRNGVVISTVSFVLTDPTRSLATAEQLGNDVSGHISAVLAASGSTGPSGASGPTGATR